MMKNFIFCFVFLLATFTATAQDAAELHETARTFMRQGDYTNAILVLNRATKLDPKNIEILKDLGLNYYFSKDYPKALEVYKPLLDRADADDQCFQIAGSIYKAMGDFIAGEKLYKKAIKKFYTSM